MYVVKLSLHNVLQLETLLYVLHKELDLQGHIHNSMASLTLTETKTVIQHTQAMHKKYMQTCIV